MAEAEPASADDPRTYVVTDDCHGCGICARACEAFAIAMVESGGRRRARIDTERCVLSRRCVDVCPVEAITVPYPLAWEEGEGSPG